MKKSENDNSIVFINKPITTREEDVIGFDAHIDSIKEAINKNASIIGIISDYGTGKSSIVDILSHEHIMMDCITINMWDSLDNSGKQVTDGNGQQSVNGDGHSLRVSNSETNQKESLSVLVKSFIYQLGKKKKDYIGNHVNKILSNNYNIFSFSVGYKKFWLCLVGAIIFISLFFAMGSNGNATIIQEALGWSRNSISNIKMWFLVLRPISLVVAILLLVYGLRDTHLVFSRFDKKDRRKAEINEVFAAYSYVYRKLERLFRKSVVVIEDLDRICDEKKARDFLKELYRINNICKNRRFRKQPVFVVAISKESMDEDNIFSKIFDYEIELNCVHIEDYRDVLKEIIDKDETNKPRLMRLVFGENSSYEKNHKNEEILLNYCKWLYEGEHLTIRELKDRLNKTIEKYSDIRNKGYQGLRATDFETCSAIVYLERQYPKYFYSLVKKEKKFAELIEETQEILINDKDGNTKNQIIDAINNYRIFKDKDDDYELFVDELSDMIVRGLVNRDYRMYFYAYPKGSYIKSSEEEMICNCLYLPNKNDYDENKISEQMQKVIRYGETVKIEEAIKSISSNENINSFSEIILEDEFLFDLAITYGKNKAINTFINVLKNNFSDEKTRRLLNNTTSYENYSVEFEELLIEKLCIECSALDADDTIRIRKKLIDAYKDDLVRFKRLFCNGEEYTLPLISDSEIEKIDNNKISIELVDIDNITENNSDYIQKLICDAGYLDGLEDKLVEIQKQIIKRVGFEDVKEQALSFMTSSRVIDVFLFENICDSIRKDELKGEELTEYLKSIDLESIPNEYYREINNLLIIVDLSDQLLERLLNEGLYDTALIVCSNTDRFGLIDINEEDSEVIIKESIKRINDRKPELVSDIRKNMLLQNERVCFEKYKELFIGDYNMISADELEVIKDFKISLELINYGALDKSNYSEIIGYYNKDIRELEDCYLIMYNLLTKVKQSAITMREIMNSIDYDMVLMYSLKESEKENVVTWMKKIGIITLNGTDAKRWMLKWDTVVPSLEKLVKGETTPEQFNDMLNQIKELSSYSKEIIENDEPKYGYCDEITRIFLDDGFKKHYIVGKILYLDNFDYPMYGVKDDDLITCYYDNSPVLIYLQKKESFMNSVWNNKEYRQFENVTWEMIEPFTKYEQTADFFDYIVNNMSDVIVKMYFRELNTIKTADDSLYIVDEFIKGHLFKFVENDEVFKHIKYRIWENDEVSSGKKGALTKAYNKYKNNHVPATVS